MNPNPRPPNERKPGSQTYFPLTSGRGPTGATASPGVSAGAPTAANPTAAAMSSALPSTTPTATPLTAAGISNLLPNATDALGLSSYSPTQGQPDPRDADYWKNLNNLLFNTQGKIRDLNLAGERATLDYGKNTFDLNTSRKRGQRSLGESAISQGLANSGWLARNEAEDASDYLRNDEDLRTGYQRGATDRQTSISQAIQDYIAGEGDLAGSALTRYLAGQNTAAQEGAGVQEPTQGEVSVNAGGPEFYVNTQGPKPGIVGITAQGPGEFAVDTTGDRNKPKKHKKK